MAKNVEERLSDLEEAVKKTNNFTKGIHKSIGVRGTFKLAGIEWKVLDKTESGYLCHATEKYGDERAFDSACNDWKSSNLRNELNTKLFKKIADEIGEENIIEFERDLLSLDGQTEYGTCKDKVSLLTVDEYRKYRKFIPNTDDYYWWLITPDSTKCNNDSKWVNVVSPRGGVYDCSCSSDFGVRPVCIFSSSIFESEE